MTFERQKCRYCKKICFCVDVRSLDIQKYHFKHPFWICEFDISKMLDPNKMVQYDKQIEEIMVECGIENIERWH